MESVTRLVLTMGVLLLLSAAAGAQGTAPSKPEGVGIEERLGDDLPLDLDFIHDTGRPVKLGELFDGERPVILNLGYYGCPSLCGIVLNGLLEGLTPLEKSVGEDYTVISVTISPKETFELARDKKKNYLEKYGRPGAERGWHFLTGSQESITALTEAVGFHYKWVERDQQYAHDTAIFICTPDGRLSNVLYGVSFKPKTLEASLELAAGESVYDPETGELERGLPIGCYSPTPLEGFAALAFKVMQWGAAAVALALFGVLGVSFLRKRHAPVNEEAEE